MSPRPNKTIVDSLAFRQRRHRGNKKHIFPVWFIVLLRVRVPREWSLANLGERLAYETRGAASSGEDGTGIATTTTRMVRGELMSLAITSTVLAFRQVHDAGTWRGNCKMQQTDKKLGDQKGVYISGVFQ